ncbi:hypothetical protein ELD05_09505 [Caldicellulosiruptor changbaiensis]|uniref:Type IV pilus assembly protein PilO n=1 Tax=Caldicellulosiruptor changbaiensis TaxID=1222016 RepID=A0A3T0D6X9_9FIRM|nr:type II secretion system protein GspM [Caldicellulosiruptor changbaiensis]AZT90855.1 hypothetical protein ELD05_09505 [Caldicellulosiruptor changbaiensis]
MQITDRDKKLLMILVMFLVAVAFYNFFYKPYSEKLSQLKSEKQTLENRLNEINQRIASYNLSKERLQEIEELYADLSNKIPPNQDEKFSMLDLKRLSEMVGAKTSDYTFSQKQKVNTSINNINIVNAYYYSSKQNWQITYANFKKLLYLQKDFSPLFSLDGITLSNANDKIAASFEIRFYGFEDNLAQPRQWPQFRMPTGKGDIFKGGTAPKIKFNYTEESIKKNENPAQSALKMERTDNATVKQQGQITSVTPTDSQTKEKSNNAQQSSTQQTEQNIDFNKADFVATISTLYSPTTNISLEKTGKGSIFGAKKNIENAYIRLEKRDNKYYFKMGTEGSIFPQDGNGEEFVPNSSNYILIVIFSTPRKFKDDKNVVTMTVNNATDKITKVYILNDDKQKPRVNVVTKGSNVQVIRK